MNVIFRSSIMYIRVSQIAGIFQKMPFAKILGPVEKKIGLKVNFFLILTL